MEIPLTTSESTRSRRVNLFSDRSRQLLESSEALLHPPQLRDLRILIIEDDPDTRDLLKTVLEQCGSKVIAVPSAQEGLEEVSRSVPEVLVSDIGMAGENGSELIEKIRKLDPKRGGRIPAVALTAYAGPTDRRRALLAGFQTHLAKPVEPDELLAVIASLVDK